MTAMQDLEGHDPLGGGGLSPRSSAGEDMMQDFVRMQMTSILQPFAECTRELKLQVQQLDEGIRSFREVTDSHASVLEQHAGQLVNLQAKSGELDERLEQTLAEVVSAKKEKNRLDGNHEMTKAAVSKTKDSLATVAASVEALQAALGAGNSRTAELEKALKEVEERLAEQLESRLDKQGKVCKELSARQAETQKACQQARSLADTAGSGVKKLEAAVEKLRAEDAASSSELRERATSLEAWRLENGKALELHGSGIRTLEEQVQSLQTWEGQVDSIKHLHAKQAEAVSSFASQVQRLDRVEQDVSSLRGNTTSDQHALSKEVHRLEEKISSTGSDLNRWRDVQRAHAEFISTANNRIGELEGFQQSLASRAEHTEGELRSLGSWRAEASPVLQTQSTAIEAVRGEALVAQHGVQQADEALRALRAEVGAEREVLSKQAARLDTCYKYFHGLSKGLQDTHRQLVGDVAGALGSSLPLSAPPKGIADAHRVPVAVGSEGGALPPKIGGGSSVLPAIPRDVQPRAPGAEARRMTPRGSASPRRHIVGAAA